MVRRCSLAIRMCMSDEQNPLRGQKTSAFPSARRPSIDGRGWIACSQPRRWRSCASVRIQHLVHGTAQGSQGLDARRRRCQGNRNTYAGGAESSPRASALLRAAAFSADSGKAASNEVAATSAAPNCRCSGALVRQDYHASVRSLLKTTDGRREDYCLDEK